METYVAPPVFACDDCAEWVCEEQLNHVRRLETLHVGTDTETTKVGVKFICKSCVDKQFGGCDMYADEKIVNSISIHVDDLVDNQVPSSVQDRISKNFYIVMVQSHQQKEDVTKSTSGASDSMGKDQ